MHLYRVFFKLHFQHLQEITALCEAHAWRPAYLYTYILFIFNDAVKWPQLG